jgi:uncharacterized protein (DUF58 family)
MGAYTDLDSLVGLQFKARGFNLSHSQPVGSLLFGRRISHVRGRGLDFEEMRNYVFGDDVRSIDWRVTARMQKPFVRIYSEERDRPTMLVVDQRINMFFGSRVSMKSVIAAEVAALAAWRVLQQGDRIGAFIFNDEKIAEVRMHHSRANLLRILSRIAQQNRELRADTPIKSRPDRLNAVIEAVACICKHDALIIISSDFDGADHNTRNLLLNLSRSNDVVCCLTYDPLAVKLPAAEQLIVSNGELQMELLLGQEKVRKNILEASDKRIRSILSWQHEIGVPVFPISTAEDTAVQVRHLLINIAAPRRRK